jgi:hypothetical protein
MHGKLFREWVLFLKKRKLYSKFILHYRAANISARTWERKKPSFKLLNGEDCIMPNKTDSLSFDAFLSTMRTIEWYVPLKDWISLATEFGELKGYIEKKKADNMYGLYWFDDDASHYTSYMPRHVRKARHAKRREVYTKWYDRYYIDTVKNRYRR